MKKLFLDWETAYTDEYSLKKITPIEYVLDPRFESLGCGFVWGDGQRYWVDGPLLEQHFATVDWPNTFAVSHNASFDMLILALRYKHIPGFYGDTLAMARNWISHSLNSLSLESCCAFYGQPPKWNTASKFKGYSFDLLKQNPELYRETWEYAIDDATKCSWLFNRFMHEGFPIEQLRVVDWVVRMACEPKFEIDRDVLVTHLYDVQTKKQNMLEKIGLDDNKNLMSDASLAQMLLISGVTPPTKISKTTGLQAFAFAKSDKAFTALLDHEDQYVQDLVAARLGHKSTIEESRTQRLLDISNVTPVLPVPLKYSGAHTHRFSGDWKINLQNLTRDSYLRWSLRAPKGKVVVSVDASQIEARLNATLSGQWDLVEQFRRGEDVYAIFAVDIYKYPVTKKTHPTERFVGKTGILSLGYGSSPPVFQNMCRVQGNVHLTDSEATSIVFIYRDKHRNIVENWKHADRTLLPIIAGSNTFGSILPEFDPHVREWGPLRIEHNAILLPNGNKLRYRDLRHVHNDNKFEWMFMRGTIPQKIYGAKLVENVIQALAFVHIEEVALRVADMFDGQLLPAHQVHDELIYVVDEEYGEAVRDIVIAEMSKPPEWMPLAPLAAEGKLGYSYGSLSA